MKNNEREATLSAFIALLVIFFAMINPLASALVAIMAFIGYGVYKYRTLPSASSMRPFVLSALIACLFVLSWSALHDILKAKQPSYYFEYAALGFALIALFYLVRRSNTTKKTKKKKK